MIKKEDAVFLNQLVKTLEQAEVELEKAYKEKDYDNFDKSKKIILRIQGKISEISGE